MRWFLLAVLLSWPAWGQDKAPAPARNAVLALQQLSVAMEILANYYEARIEELRRLCGDPCKDK
jgi:hypothetical protein